MTEAPLPSELRHQLERYLAARRAIEIAPRTLVGDEHAVRRFTTWIESERPGLTALVSIDRLVLEDFALHLAMHETPEGARLKAATRNRQLTALRSFFRWLEAEGHLLRDPARHLPVPRIAEQLPRGILSIPEMKKLLSANNPTTPRTLRDRTMVELVYSTGIRNAELRALTIGDFDLGEGLLTVRHGKGNKQRVVPFGKMAGRFLERYLAEARPRLVRSRIEETLFLSERGGRPLHNNDVCRMMRKVGAAARLKKPVTCHGLRHTCATHLLRNHADIRHIQELLGHKRLSTTQIYTHVSGQDLKRVHSRCHPRELE